AAAASEPRPDARLEAAESLTMSFMLLLERLTPAERAAFLLHDVFDYPFDEVAAMLGKTSAACRKLAERARAHVREARPRFEVRHQDAYRILSDLFDAAGRRDMDGVASLLAEEAELWSDGGGKAVAARHVLHGPRQIAHLLCAITAARRHYPGTTDIAFRDVNGLPGAVGVTRAAGEQPQVEFVLSVEVDDGRILKIHNVRNPDKLAHVTPDPGGDRVVL
ncbi:MAG: sigma factor-like helix-turn-helix DNA-binding protein, partial [Hyphomicrobiales bacterium]